MAGHMEGELYAVNTYATGWVWEVMDEEQSWPFMRLSEAVALSSRWQGCPPLPPHFLPLEGAEIEALLSKDSPW